MSVNKYIVGKKPGNFTTIPNKVLQGLKDFEALGLYVYLLSLPTDWVFYKSTMQEHANVGVKKLNRLLKILENCNLIKTAQIRNAHGRFAHFYLEVNDGTSFEYKELEKTVQPYVQNGRTVTVGRKRTTTNKTKTNETKTNEISKSYCATNIARENPANDFFDQFWDIYPRKKNKSRSKDIWKRKKYDEIAPLILEDVKNRILNEQQWQNEQFIPHPSTYLRNKLWEDELTLPKLEQKNTKFDPVSYTLNRINAHGRGL